MSEGLQQLIDRHGGDHTAWLIVRQWGSHWPWWLTERLRGVPLVVLVVQEPGEAHDTLCDRVHARVAETGLLNHRVNGVVLCRRRTGLAERTALVNVVAEQVVVADQVAKARARRVISDSLLN